MAITIMEKWRTTYIMVMVCIIQQQMAYFKESGSMEKQMDMEWVKIQAEISTQGFMWMTKGMEKVLMFIQMVKDMKGNSSQMLSQVKENIIMQMEISIKENGKMIYTTDMVRKDIMMAQCMRVLGFVTKKMAQVFLQI